MGLGIYHRSFLVLSHLDDEPKRFEMRLNSEGRNGKNRPGAPGVEQMRETKTGIFVFIIFNNRKLSPSCSGPYFEGLLDLHIQE